MTNTPPPRDEAAMADILASIRRIVAEEDRRTATTASLPPVGGGEVFELTAEMRIDDDAPRDNTFAAGETDEMVAPTIDEAAVADIARAVLREELNGPVGVALTRNVRKLIAEEVERLLAGRH